MSQGKSRERLRERARVKDAGKAKERKERKRHHKEQEVKSIHQGNVRDRFVAVENRVTDLEQEVIKIEAEPSIHVKGEWGKIPREHYTVEDTPEKSK